MSELSRLRALAQDAILEVSLCEASPTAKRDALAELSMYADRQSDLIRLAEQPTGYQVPDAALDAAYAHACGQGVTNG